MIGEIHAGLDADVAARLTDWRAMKSAELLRSAIARWWQEGRLDRRKAAGPDMGEAVRVARHPFATPALMQLAIARADDARAENALGYVIKALGAVQGGSPLTPYLHDQSTINHWQQLEAKVANAERTKASLASVALRIDQARRQQEQVHRRAASRGG